MVEANFLLCIWKHILWLICFSVYRNSKHCLPSPHIKFLTRWCTGSSLELRRKSGCVVCRLRFGVVSISHSAKASSSTVSSLSLCQGFLILGSHSATHCYFSFQRAFPTTLSCFVSPVSVTCAWDGGLWLQFLDFSAERLKHRLWLALKLCCL